MQIEARLPGKRNKNSVHMQIDLTMLSYKNLDRCFICFGHLILKISQSTFKLDERSNARNLYIAIAGL